MHLRFVTLDVFTQTRLAGNPLAVVIDADGLDPRQMQAIAKEFNLAETVFILQPADPDHRARLRIFTPAAELPFAGHPTVGTAVLLGCMTGTNHTRELVLEEPIGLVRCRVTPRGRTEGHASFAIPRLPAEAGPPPNRREAAAALNLNEGDIGFDDFRPARWSAGVALTFVPVRSLTAIVRARPDGARFESAFGGGVAGHDISVLPGDPRAREPLSRPHVCARSGHSRGSGDGCGGGGIRGTAFREWQVAEWPTRHPHRAGRRNGSAKPDRTRP